MRRTIISLAIAAIFAILAACATAPGNSAPPSPGDIANQICPSIIAVGEVLTVPGAVDPSIAADLEAAAPLVTAACSTGVQLPDLAALHDNALPVLVKLIQLAPIDPGQKASYILGISVARAVLGPVLHRE